MFTAEYTAEDYAPVSGRGRVCYIPYCNYRPVVQAEVPRWKRCAPVGQIYRPPLIHLCARCWWYLRIPMFHHFVPQHQRRNSLSSRYLNLNIQ